MKLLVSGSPAGDWATLCSKVSKVNSGPAGPFDALFIVGRVTAADQDEDDGEMGIEIGVGIWIWVWI